MLAERDTAIPGFPADANRVKPSARSGRVVPPDHATRRRHRAEHRASVAVFGPPDDRAEVAGLPAPPA